MKVLKAIKCKRCGDIIESKHQRDYKMCKCGSVSVDGGRACPRVSYKADKDDQERNELKYIEEIFVETRTVLISIPSDPPVEQKLEIPKEEPYVVYIVKCKNCKEMYAKGSYGLLNKKCTKCGKDSLEELDWIDFN